MTKILCTKTMAQTMRFNPQLPWESHFQFSETKYLIRPQTPFSPHPASISISAETPGLCSIPPPPHADFSFIATCGGNLVNKNKRENLKLIMPFNQSMCLGWWNQPGGGRGDRGRSSGRRKANVKVASVVFVWAAVDFPLYKVVIQISQRGLISVKRRAIRRHDCNVSWKCSHAFILQLPGVAGTGSLSLLLSCPWMPQTLLSQLQGPIIQPWRMLLKKEMKKSDSSISRRGQDHVGKRGCWSGFRHAPAEMGCAAENTGQEGNQWPTLRPSTSPDSICRADQVSKFSPVKLLETKSGRTLRCQGLGNVHFQTLLLEVWTGTISDMGTLANKISSQINKVHLPFGRVISLLGFYPMSISCTHNRQWY